MALNRKPKIIKRDESNDRRISKTRKELMDARSRLLHKVKEIEKELAQ